MHDILGVSRNQWTNKEDNEVNYKQQFINPQVLNVLYNKPKKHINLLSNKHQLSTMPKNHVNTSKNQKTIGKCVKFPSTKSTRTLAPNKPAKYFKRIHWRVLIDVIKRDWHIWKINSEARANTEWKIFDFHSDNFSSKQSVDKKETQEIQKYRTI